MYDTRPFLKKEIGLLSGRTLRNLSATAVMPQPLALALFFLFFLVDITTSALPIDTKVATSDTFATRGKGHLAT